MDNFKLQTVQELCRQHRIVWREHALQRMVERNILKQDVMECIYSGNVIESYPDDYPVPSGLVLGTAIDGRWLHVVCSVYEDMVCIITAYFPDVEHWESDMKTRKRGN